MKFTDRDDFTDLLIEKSEYSDGASYNALRYAVYQCCSLTELEKIAELFIKELEG